MRHAGLRLMLSAAGLRWRTFRGSNAVIVWRSNLVGKPMAQLLLRGKLHGDGGSLAHQADSLADVVRQADIVVAAVGSAARW